jgi:thiamine pyrophosphokinase
MVFMINKRIVIFANGDLPDPEKARKLIMSDDVLIAADAGARHILELGLIPARAIGDFDSISSDDLTSMRSAGVEMIPYPSNKDKTDLDLAIDLALVEGVESILVLAAFGGRLDMVLSNISLLFRPDLQYIDIHLDDGLQEVFLIKSYAKIIGNSGDMVSLIPWGKNAEGVSTQGLHWSLHHETMEPFSSRGISNEMLGSHAEVTIQEGSLLCFHRRNGVEELKGKS